MLGRRRVSRQELVEAARQLLSDSGQSPAEPSPGGRSVTVPASHVVSDLGAGSLSAGLSSLSHEVGEAGLPEILRLCPASPPLRR